MESMPANTWQDEGQVSQKWGSGRWGGWANRCATLWKSGGGVVNKMLWLVQEDAKTGMNQIVIQSGWCAGISL